MTYLSDKYDQQTTDVLDNALVSVTTKVVKADVQPLLTVDYMKAQVLRVGHTVDDARVKRAIGTARVMMENAYGICLAEQTITFMAIGPARKAILPAAGGTIISSVKHYVEGAATDQDLASFYLSGGYPQALMAKAGALVVPVGVDQVEVTYTATPIQFQQCVEAWALTAAQVYEYKVPYAIGVSVGQLPDMAMQVMEGLGFVNVGI